MRVTRGVAGIFLETESREGLGSPYSVGPMHSSVHSLGNRNQLGNIGCGSVVFPRMCGQVQ